MRGEEVETESAEITLRSCAVMGTGRHKGRGMARRGKSHNEEFYLR